jgi:multidrug resistance efflux pump
LVSSNQQAVFLLTALGAILAAAGAGAFLLLRQPEPSPAAGQPAPQPEMAPGTEVALSGPVQHRLVVGVPPLIDGVLDSVEVQLGDEVFAGQLLGRVRNEELASFDLEAREDLLKIQARVNETESRVLAARLEASRAAADASRAQADFERLKKIADRQALLHGEGATPRLEYEKAQANLKPARDEYDALREASRLADERVQALAAELDAVRASLNTQTTETEATSADIQAADIVSPVDGVLVAAAAAPGDPVNPDMLGLFQVSPNPYWLKVIVEPEPPILERIAAGLPALVFFSESPSTPFEGAVSGVQNGRVEIAFDTPEPLWRAGSTATARIKLP